MTKIAMKHGGTVDKYIGDAIMVFFGAPQSKDIIKAQGRDLVESLKKVNPRNVYQ